jgi:hypothetical protein
MTRSQSQAFHLPKPLPDELLRRMVVSLHDPVEVMRFAEDYYTLGARIAERECARLTKRPLPKLPRPRSVYMRKLLAALGIKLAMFALVFTRDEIRRMGRIAPEFLRRVGEGDRELAEHLVELFSIPPESLPAWVRERLPQLETRLAS